MTQHANPTSVYFVSHASRVVTLTRRLLLRQGYFAVTKRGVSLTTNAPADVFEAARREAFRVLV